MSHVNARLTVHGRLLIVDRVAAGRPVAHIAAELGVSRQTAYRWIRRFRAEGAAGLPNRSSRPRSSPARTSPNREQAVLDARRSLRFGPLRIAAFTGVPARTVSRILHRHGVPRLADCDPLTGAPIRAARTTANRYERARPGELVHLDVKKLGRIPDGGGWRAHGRSEQVKGRGIGYDYVHVAIDDHTRIGYAEVLPDEKGATAAGFLTRARGLLRRPRHPTDRTRHHRQRLRLPQLHNVPSGSRRSRSSSALHQAPLPLDQRQAERFNRTLQTEWAYRQVFTSSNDRQSALAPWLQHYNTERIHTGIGTTPITRVSPT